MRSPSLPTTPSLRPYLDVSSRIEAVQLVDELQHRPLDLIIASSTVVKASAADRVNFVKEDQTGLLGACHLEQLSDHPGALARLESDGESSNVGNVNATQAIRW